MKKLWAKRGLRWTIIVVVLIAVIGVSFGRSKPPEYETAIVERADVVATVTATGQIKPKEYASLRFKTTGIIGRLFADVGAPVKAGQTLAILDTSELSKRVIEAQAEVVAAQVAVANSEQEVKDTDVKNVQSLDLLYADAPSTFAEILNDAQKAYATLSTFFNSNDRLNAQIADSILSSQIVTDTNNGKVLSDDAMASLRLAIENFPLAASRSQIDTALTLSAKPLHNLQTGLTAIINAIAVIPAGTLPASTLDSYVTALAVAKTNLNTAVSKETTLRTNIRDSVVQGGLKVNTSAAAQRTAAANLEKAKATLAISQQNLADASLRAPFSGTIASKDKQVGELVTTADQVYYVIGQGGLQVIANIPEIDIARIRTGMDAQITLDAYGSEVVFAAKVSEIDPAETVVDGVATYKVKFELTEPGDQLRSGMTANIMIITDTRQDVLVVSQRAVTGKNGSKTVRVLSGEAVTDVGVKTGLKGTDGTIEIIEGLTEGQVIVTGTK